MTALREDSQIATSSRHRALRAIRHFNPIRLRVAIASVSTILPRMSTELPASDPRTALAASLEALATLAAKADQAQYAQGLAVGFHSPLGAHFRHSIDHVDALLNGIANGEVCYDRRERGTVIEHDRAAGLAAAADRAALVRAISDTALSSPITVFAMTAPQSPEVRFTSTVAREVLYVFHHTVHHTALMSAQATNMGVQPDPKAGRAPATLANDGKAAQTR